MWCYYGLFCVIHCTILISKDFESRTIEVRIAISRRIVPDVFSVNCGYNDSCILVHWEVQFCKVLQYPLFFSDKVSLGIEDLWKPVDMVAICFSGLVDGW